MDQKLREGFLNKFRQTFRSASDQRRGLEAMGVLTPDEIENLMKSVETVNATNLIEVMAIAFVWSDYMPRCNVEDFDRAYYARIGESKLELPTNYWDKASGSATVESGMLLGKTLVSTGAATSADVDHALATQRTIKDKTGLTLKLGVIMLFGGMITFGEYLQALAVQQNVQWSDNVAEVFARVLRCPV